MSQIHHYSISVQDTKRVAEVLCELFEGTITPFGPYQNWYIVWFGDEHGSAIELYPAHPSCWMQTDATPRLLRQSSDYAW